MTTKVIYFTVGGFPEQAQFNSDDTLEDVRGNFSNSLPDYIDASHSFNSFKHR